MRKWINTVRMRSGKCSAKRSRYSYCRGLCNLSVYHANAVTIKVTSMHLTIRSAPTMIKLMWSASSHQHGWITIESPFHPALLLIRLSFGLIHPQEEKRKLDDALQRLKIESLRKSSADIMGRSSIGATSTSDSSSSNASKKGSTSKGFINGALKGVSRPASLARTKSQLITSTAPGSAGGAAPPSSGSNSLSAKRGSIPLGQKLRSTSPTSTRKPPGVPSASPSPIADGAPSKDQVPRRNSAKR